MFSIANFIDGNGPRGNGGGNGGVFVCAGGT